MWREKVKLQQGETLVHKRSASKGFMAEEDVDEYDVLDADGKVVGQVVYTDHTAVNGFRRTQTIRQTNKDGGLVTEAKW